MKNINNIAIIFLVLLLTSSCILEEVEPEYDVVGAVGTIATLTASSTSPEPGQTVTFNLTIYSEHENATELRMNRMVAGTATNIETKSFTNWNVEDSYAETFQYQVPEDTAGTSVVIQFQLFTTSGFVTNREITLNVPAAED